MALIFKEKYLYIYLILLFVIALINFNDAIAQTTNPTILNSNGDIPKAIILNADQITEDNELDIITAKGNVEIIQDGRVILADRISYGQRSDTLSASGNVRIIEPSGEILFTNYLELRNGLKDGLIKKIQILLSDNSRIAANSAIRSGGNKIEMRNAVYSPCDICKENPKKSPLWQIKAKRVVHDRDAKKIEYHSAIMEIGGVPIIYTPYFSHPDPSVKRKSGFLIPNIGSTTHTGIFTQIPYFITLDDDKDITFNPILTTKEGLFLSGEYRQQFNNGKFKISGSLVNSDLQISKNTNGSNIRKNNYARGHIFAKGDFDINNTWRSGFDINLASDQTYLKKFKFWNTAGNSLTSNIYAEAFSQRSYVSVNAYKFQDLRTGHRPNTPKILPMLDYNGMGNMDKLGGRWSIDANFRGLKRADSANSLRMSAIGGYQVPFTSASGYVTTLSANIRSDLYYTKHNSITDNLDRAVKDGTDFRLHGNIGVDWRYPLVRKYQSGYQIFEPVVSLFVAPDSDIKKNIRNEDSTVIESDDTNLFSANRAPGLDIIEGGIRAVYGFKIANYFKEGGLLSAFIGQSYKFNNETPQFTNVTQIEKHRSDILGRVTFNSDKFIDLRYRFAIDERQYKFNRNELGFDFDIMAVNFSGDYTYISNSSNVNKTAIEEIKLSANRKIGEYWSINGHITKDLTSGGKIRKSGLGIKYEDECLVLSGNIDRDYTKNLNYTSSDSFFLRITFKTLGEIDLIQ